MIKPKKIDYIRTLRDYMRREPMVAKKHMWHKVISWTRNWTLHQYDEHLIWYLWHWGLINSTFMIRKASLMRRHNTGSDVPIYDMDRAIDKYIAELKQSTAGDDGNRRLIDDLTSAADNDFDKKHKHIWLSLMKRAQNNEFHNFKSQHACPSFELDWALDSLIVHGIHANVVERLKANCRNGVYD